MHNLKPIQVGIIVLMRICCCQFLIATTFAALCYSYDIKGQQLLDQPVSLNAQNENIKTVLRKIEKSLSVKITYRSNVIDTEKTVKVSFDKTRLKEVLDELFNHTITYEVFKRQIILHPRKLPDSGALIEEEFSPLLPLTEILFSVTGIVNDETGHPLPGVNIIEKGTTNGTTTDSNGSFTINVLNNESVLVFSFIGYDSEEVVVGGQTTLAIQLFPDIKALQEIVVVGYGEVKKSDLTGAVASIQSEDLNAYPTTNLMQALAGRATGVQVSQNSGSPGGSISVRIRGTNSVRGDNEPLYVVDGFPYSGNPTLLNNADIASIEILKDASATAIYGSRGANGVVLITTKRGKAGKTNVEYDGYFGWQTVRKKIDMMNARQYAEFYNEQAANDGLSPHFTQEEIDSFGEGTDWQDVVFRTAPIQNHAVNVNGGTEKLKFSVSGSNFNQGGIITGSNYIRNSIRTNINTDLSKKFALDLSAVLSQFDTDRKTSGQGNRGSSLISAFLTAYPTVGTHNDDGTYTNLGEFYSWGSNALVNPLNWIEQESDHLRSNKVLTNAALTFKPVEGLSIKVSGGIQNNDDRRDYYQTTAFINSQGSATVETDQATTLLNENTISYEKEIGRHNLSAVAGFTYQNYKATSLDASGSGFVSDVQGSYDISAAATQGIPASSYSEWTLLSYLGRVNYSFNDKYLATISFRADGSSRYSEGDKWGFFPSAGLAWKLSEEEFIKNIPFISNLKLRAGYGETGSTAINAYYTLNQLSSSQVVFNDDLYVSYAPDDRLAGPLKWETTAQTDVGLDAGFLDNRFSVTVDYYVKDTRDLLNTVSLPSSQGYSYTVKNVGKVQNRGWEFSANAVVLDGNFKWNLDGNISFNKNEVVKLYGGKDVLGEAIGVATISDNINILREGEAIGSFYGYIEKGYDDTGKIVYEDYNGSGSVDSGDKRIIGNPHPDFVYGLSSTMSFKNFELNVFIQGTQGNDIFNISSVNQTLDYSMGLNMPVDVYEDHWTAENTDAKYPKISKSTGTQASDRFLEDGSYLRFKNIQLSYNLPVSKLGLNWLTRAQLYASGQNLITFTKYSWYDPEINSYGSGNSIRLGIDHYSYPTAKTVTVGVRLGF